MILYVIRHGETALNVKGIMQGWMDEPLNENGRYLAVETGKALRGIHFDHCCSSPLVRATETAEIILRESGNDLPIQLDDRIREIHFGELEGTRPPKEEAASFFRNPFQFGRFPQGESVEEVCLRTQSFLRELIADDREETWLVSSHGCAIRAMLNGLYEDPSDFWQGHPPYNCAVSILEAKSGVPRILKSDQVYYDADLIVDRYKVK